MVIWLSTCCWNWSPKICTKVSSGPEDQTKCKKKKNLSHQISLPVSPKGMCWHDDKSFISAGWTVRLVSVKPAPDGLCVHNYCVFSFLVADCLHEACILSSLSCLWWSVKIRMFHSCHRHAVHLVFTLTFATIGFRDTLIYRPNISMERYLLFWADSFGL